MQKGFTLIEMVLVVVIVAILILIVIAAINPIEQLHKVEDSAKETNAKELLNAIERYQANGENPQIINSANSYVCEDIISAGPVVDTNSLEDELSDWFPRQIVERGQELYAGFITGRVKICYRVKAIRNIEISSTDGCNVGYLYFLCLPK
jgi:prepilin-type N-terminal cleavage/methylation domain-containing protein